MRLLTWNIQYGLGRDDRYDIARIAREIAAHEADVVALQEVERFWQRSGMIDEPAELAARLPGYHWVFGANLDMHAGTAEAPDRRRQFGTMLLSRTPILSTRNFPLPKLGALAQHSIQQGALEGVILTPAGRPLRLYSVHLSHLCSETRLPQVEALLDIDARAYAEGGAWCGGHPDPSAGWTEGEMPPMPREAVMMGDFNFRHDSPEYARICGPWTERYGRITGRGGFADAWTAAGHAEAEGDTCKGGGRIDHVFLSAWLAEKVLDARIDGQAEGSDHQPVVVEIDY
ncbi:endonuclease/exonuclease/phosphatase family protein [Geminicoccaceae bacterium 1502E]|nr:endonuclease/exonuclease/phosphatase family protein [Geminicoccaceae bacterium 1502E]